MSFFPATTILASIARRRRRRLRLRVDDAAAADFYNETRKLPSGRINVAYYVRRWRPQCVCVRVFIKPPENDCEDDNNNNNILEGEATRETFAMRTVMCRVYRGASGRGANITYNTI